MSLGLSDRHSRHFQKNDKTGLNLIYIIRTDSTEAEIRDGEIIKTGWIGKYPQILLITST